MLLDSFLISLVFDDKAAKSSAGKIDGIVKDLSKSIVESLTAIASIDFLKSAVEQFTQMSTQLDNLSYLTKASTGQLSAWAEAVKRNGGTADGFYQSLTNLNGKMREIQTSFGSEGQMAFMRLGINIKNANGTMKTSIQVLSELGDKFKSLPQVWQMKLGEQLGLDPATIRLLSQGNTQVTSLVKHMQELGLTNQMNVQQGVKWRNTMMDLQLVWRSMSNTIASMLIPPLQVLANIATNAIVFLRNNSYLVQSGLIAIATVVSMIMIPAFIRLTVAMAPFLAIGAVIAGITLVLQDFMVWLHGGNSEFGKFYKWLFGSREHAEQLINKLKEFAPTLLKIVAGVTGLIVAFSLLKTVASGVVAVFKGFEAVRTLLGLKKITDAAKDAAKSFSDLEQAANDAEINPSAANDATLSSGSSTAEAAIGEEAATATVVGGVATASLSSYLMAGGLGYLFGNQLVKAFPKIPEYVGGKAYDAVNAISRGWNISQQAVANTITSVAKSLGFSPDIALTVAQAESQLNPNAHSHVKGSTASGVFQLNDSTGAEFGAAGANKNNLLVNATAGIKNLIATAATIQKATGVKPEGWQILMGEMVGVGAVTKILKADPNSMLSSILSAKAISANKLQGMTIGQFEQMKQRQFSQLSQNTQHSVTVGAIHVTSNSADPHQVANKTLQQLGKHANLVYASDNGRIL